MGFILGTTLGWIFILILIGVSLYFAYKKKTLNKLIKRLGAKAEEQVNNDIRIWTKHTKNKFIGPNVFKYNEDKVFEVDSIVLTKEAIIVVEIKSINGGIKGDVKDKTWTKVLGDKTFPISNPIIQNEKHIEHIIKMIETKIPIISLVVFSNKAKFIDIKNIPNHAIIIRHADIFETLDKLTINLEPKLSDENIKLFNSKIKSFIADKKGISLHKRITKGKVKK